MRTAIDSEKSYWAYFNRFELSLPGQCVLDCSASGSVDNEVAYWASHISPSERCTEDAIRKELAEYGAWDEEELSDDDQNWQRLIWIAACNVAEESEPEEAS